MIRLRSLLFIVLFFVSCSPSNLADLRKEGKAQTKKLVTELREIETKEDLKLAIPRLKKRFNRLADILIQARQFPLNESGPSAASEELFAELARLYEMPGGRELIESSQAEAVHRLR